VKHRVVQGVHRLVEALDFIDLKEGGRTVVAKSAQSRGLK
jgi:hypothetical protein